MAAYVLSCGACVYRLTDDSAEILLIRSFDKYPAWGIPKGHVEPGEELIETCHREVYEEAGIKIVLEDKLPVVRKHSEKETKDVHAWLARQVGDDEPSTGLDPDCEIQDVRWFQINELPLLQSYLEPVIKTAVEFIRIRRRA